MKTTASPSSNSQSSASSQRGTDQSSSTSADKTRQRRAADRERAPSPEKSSSSAPKGHTAPAAATATRKEPPGPDRKKPTAQTNPSPPITQQPHSGRAPNAAHPLPRQTSNVDRQLDNSTFAQAHSQINSYRNQAQDAISRMVYRPDAPRVTASEQSLSPRIQSYAKQILGTLSQGAAGLSGFGVDFASEQAQSGVMGGQLTNAISKNSDIRVGLPKAYKALEELRQAASQAAADPNRALQQASQTAISTGSSLRNQAVAPIKDQQQRNGNVAALAYGAASLLSLMALAHAVRPKGSAIQHVPGHGKVSGPLQLSRTHTLQNSARPENSAAAREVNQLKDELIDERMPLPESTVAAKPLTQQRIAPHAQKVPQTQTKEDQRPLVQPAQATAAPGGISNGRTGYTPSFQRAEKGPFKDLDPSLPGSPQTARQLAQQRRKHIGSGFFSSVYSSPLSRSVLKVPRNDNNMSRNEIRAIQAMEKLGLGPKVNWQQSAFNLPQSGNGPAFLVQEKITGQHLGDATLTVTSDRQRHEIAMNVTDTFAKLNRHGWVNVDLHDYNLMVLPNNKISIVDSGGTVKFKKPISVKGRLHYQSEFQFNLKDLRNHTHNLRPSNIAPQEWAQLVRQRYFETLNLPTEHPIHQSASILWDRLRFRKVRW